MKIFLIARPQRGQMFIEIADRKSGSTPAGVEYSHLWGVFYRHVIPLG